MPVGRLFADQVEYVDTHGLGAAQQTAAYRGTDNWSVG